MGRRFTIVGLGEAVLVEHPHGYEAAGLAACIASQAARLGHAGLAVTRVGQDAYADAFLELLKRAGIDTSHVQSDPDLPTGRSIVRPAGGRIDRYLESRAAFDNLQPDFDLEDVAQAADAVVFGLLTRRGGQTRSEENRFLGACAAAFKLFDLTNRAGGAIERGHVMSALGMADAIVVDPAALSAIRPGADRELEREAILGVLRDTELAFIVMIAPTGEGSARLTLHTAGEVATVEIPSGRAAVAVACVVLIDAVLVGRPLSGALQHAARAAAHPAEPLPRGSLD